MKKFLAVAALSTFAALLIAASNPKATGSCGWTNIYSPGNPQAQTTFAAIATNASGPDAKGSLVYSDNNITYSMDVKYIRKDGNVAWFAGKVTAVADTGNVGCCKVDNWIFYKVEDGAEPGIGIDRIWGEDLGPVGSDVALNRVLKGPDPNSPAFTINSGNIQVK
jgi:hypothetical protein